MSITKTKKSFKLNVLGLFKLETEEYTTIQIACIMAMIMAFIVVVIILLKVYAIPTLGTPVLLNNIGVSISKLFKSRSP